MEKIIKKAEEVRKAISKSLEEAGFSNFHIDYVINTCKGGKFNKITFFDSERVNEPSSFNFFVKITSIENYLFQYFGKQSMDTFVLNSEAFKSIAELCEVINEYLKEREKNETKDISNK